MVDAKFFGKNIDVKHVESFIGMMQDVGVDKGLLITKLSGSETEVSSQKQFRRRFLGFGSQTALLLVFFAGGCWEYCNVKDFKYTGTDILSATGLNR